MEKIIFEWATTMNWIRRHRVFAGWVVACLAIALLEGWFIREWRLTARVAHHRVSEVTTALRKLRGRVPALTAATMASMSAELAAASIELESLRSHLTSHAYPESGSNQPPVPIERADGYFDIASFVERMREHAALQGVELKADERFGFGDYAYAGPVQEDLSFVFKERLAMESLLKTLFDSRPRQLIAVQRERRPATKSGARAVEQMNAATVRADYFDWDQRDSVRQLGSISARALRISFVSQTVSLRTLMNELAGSESSLVVRAVEVGPMSKGGVATGAEVGFERPRPLVPQSYSHFTVTVELIERADEAVAGG